MGLKETIPVCCDSLGWPHVRRISHVAYTEIERVNGIEPNYSNEVVEPLLGAMRFVLSSPAVGHHRCVRFERTRLQWHK